MTRKIRFSAALSAALLFTAFAACQTASARTPAICGGSPLAVEDNIGESILRGKRGVISVVAVAQLEETVGNTSVGWYYLDDAGLVSAVLKPTDSAAVFRAFGQTRIGGKWNSGPFFVRNGVPAGFKVAACSA